jgi:hypothetical protein
MSVGKICFFLSPNLVRKREEKKPKAFTKNVLWNKQVKNVLWNKQVKNVLWNKQVKNVLWNKQVKNVTVSLGLFRMINKKEYCGRKFLIFVEMLKLTSYTCIHIFVSW